MLYLVLILVIAAFVLLIIALTTANTLWAWVSVAISVVAAGLLIFDWLRGRRRVATTSAPRPVEAVDDVDEVDEVGAAAELEEAEDEAVLPPPPEPTEEIPPVVAEPAEAPAPVVDETEPDEEQTDAADVLVVSELSVKVVVVDEHPRYHLGTCAWLSGRETIPLPVSEARSLGFTPCARCGPDAAIAAAHRNPASSKG